MPDTPPRERMRTAAFALFDERGYDATTVGDIAEAAGVGRTTFFRAFGSKEDVIFPDHDALLASVRTRLATSVASDAATPLSVVEASRLVLDHYLEEGDLARARYRLTGSVPALRDRELASTAGYQRVFREALRPWTGEEDGDDLRAELIAAAVVTAHNHVLRRWLRGTVADALTARAELDVALQGVLDSLTGRQSPGSADHTAGSPGTTVVVLHSQADPDQVAEQVRAALRSPNRPS